MAIGVLTVGSKGASVLLNSATTTVASLSSQSTTAPLMTEAKGFSKWTFWAYDKAGTATFTVVIQGTLDAVNAGVVGTTSLWNYFQIGQFTNASTAPITFGFPMTGVYPALTAMATTGNITVLGFAVP